ncbi:MAG: hypothetical protein EXX96DRAFT_546817 [Benjaminiella poitrasii]|nr:MAG: hypothetical protein EXX96DRAFT_546817 [Benjaminiella poitrasii]
MIKKKRLLKSVLPASFIKIYEKELLEEDENRKSEKQGSKPAIVENNAHKKPKASTRDIDTFASFLGSQSDEEESSDDMQDVYPTTMDDYVIRLDTQLTETPNTNYVKSNELYIPPRHLFTSRRNIFTAKDVNQNKDSRKNDTRTDSTSLDIIQPSTNIDMNNTSSKPNIIQTNNNKSHTNDQPRITSTITLKKRNISKGNLDEESIEDNRIRGAGYRVPSGNLGRHKNRQARSKTSVKRRTPKSSIAIQKPVNIAPTFVQPIPIRDNPTPQRRRKRPKRCKDDIYVHAPVSSRIWSDKSGQLPDTNMRMFFKGSDFSSRKAFDDIYVGTQHTARYDSAPLKDGDSSDLTRNAKNPARIKEYIFDIQHSLHVVHSLQSVAKRIKHLYDHDLRRIKGLKDTVYLHHQLLAPLLSATPNLKSAYSRHKDTYAELNLFDKHLLWTNITIEESRIIDYMFFKVSRDLLQACSNAKESDTELPHHDHFYTFVSICLTQWIPCHTYENRIQLTELFMIHIRSLAWQIPRLVEEYSHKLLPWRSIVKLLIYILDWSCRLHHLGVHPIDWCVTECTQIMMDILVYIGYDSIRSKSTTREYLVEAWVCLIQIITVSSKESGYYFYEQVFIDQLIDSIKRKSRASDSYEFEKRKTTRLWAESLNYILDAYMML